MSIRKGGLRLALTVLLWGLAGIALVVLPGLLAHNPTGSTETPVNTSLKISNPTYGITSSSQMTKGSGQQQSTASDFLVRLLIIMIPAMALSALGGTWVSNRVRRVAA